MLRTAFLTITIATAGVGGAQAQATNALPEFNEISPIGGAVVWLVEPTREEIQRRHPARAAEREQGGQVDLLCRVRNAEGQLGCAIRSETPAGWAFGIAALRVSQLYRIAPTIAGEATEGRSVPLHVDFSDLPVITQYCNDCGVGGPLVTLRPRRSHRPNRH